MIKPDKTVNYINERMLVITFLGNGIANSVKINMVNFQVERLIHSVHTKAVNVLGI